MKNIYCYKQGTPLVLLAVIDDYYSLSFTRSFTGIGQWQLVLNADTANAKKVEQMDFISIDEGVAGWVSKVEKSHVEKENRIVYTGIELKGLTASRIVMPPTGNSHLSFYNKTPEYIIAQLLTTQLVSPTQTERAITNTAVAAYTAVNTGIEKHYRFQNLGEVIEELATAYGVGWYADIINGVITYHIYSGIDRTKTQSINDKLVVSYERDGIQDSTHTKSKRQPNTALVAGQGEGVEREYIIIGDEKTDIMRNELYIDARDVEETVNLPARGVEKLSQLTEENIYGINISELLKKQYRENYDLGDRGTVEDEMLEEAMDFTLTELTETYEEDDFTLEAIFGLDRTSLTYLIKRSTQTPEITPAGIGALPSSTTPGDIGAAESSHSHGIADLPTITVAKGGTGATTAAQAAINIGYTAADVLNKIKTVDGVGSGLDADLLRGSSQVMRHLGTCLDLNTAVDTGFWITYLDVTGGTFPPSVTGTLKYGILTVHSSSTTNAGYIVQNFYSMNAQIVRWQRFKVTTNAWTQWYRFEGTVDGSGIGINADTLDGLHASDFNRMKIFTDSSQVSTTDYIWNLFWGMPDNSILYHKLTITDPLYLRTSNKFPTAYGTLIITKIQASSYKVEICQNSYKASGGGTFWLASLNTSDTPSVRWFQYSGTELV